MKVSKIASSKARTYGLSSFELKKPGLLALLFKRSFMVGVADYMFHIGLYGSIITGAIMEIANLISDFAALFNGLGWLISWSHGVTGLFIVMGGVGFVVRYFKNGYFRVAYGKLFYLDLLFMLVIAITGMLQALAVFGLMPVDGFVPYPLKWIASIHVTTIYSWIVVSLFLGGAVRHGLATVVWRLANPEKQHVIFRTFSDACGRCGRCIEVCPIYEATGGLGVESPVVKIRRYLKIVASASLSAGQIKSITNQIAGCMMCGLCAAVCPFSFNFVDMYKDLLAHAKKAYPIPSLEQHAAPQTPMAKALKTNGLHTHQEAYTKGFLTRES